VAIICIALTVTSANCIKYAKSA